MLTKKHFEGIARIINAKQVTMTEKAAKDALYVIAYDLGTYFKQQNERFDHERFMEACGF